MTARLFLCRTRADEEEIIDNPDTPIEDIRATLRDQAWINRWLGGARAALRHAMPFMMECKSNPIRALDMACGGADLSRAVVDYAREMNKPVEVVAADLNEKALQVAQEQSLAYPEISFIKADALDPPFRQNEFDLVILSTFLHHLQPDDVIRVLRSAGKLSRGIVIAADLRRSGLAAATFRVLGRFLRFNPVSLHDGSVSLCRAYTPGEIADLAERAGLRDWRVFRHPFNRMTLVYAG